jgi:Acetyltransferase (GNAT) domain
VAQLLIPHSLETRGRPRLDAVVDVVSPAPRDIWRGVLRDDPGATALQTPEYFDAVVAATGGNDVSRFYQLREGRQLVLPLVRRESRLGRPHDEGYPGGYGDGGMLATGGQLADDVRVVMQDLRAESRSLRIGGMHHASEEWSTGLPQGVTEERRRVEVIDLGSRAAGHADARRTAPGNEAGRQRRGAIRLGVEVEQDATGRLIPVFSDLYRATVERALSRSERPPRVGRRPARRAESSPDFTTVAARMGRACRVFVAWSSARPIAATILLVHGQHATVWRSVVEPAAPTGTDLLLRATAVDDALRSGCRDITLGVSGSEAHRSGSTSSLGSTSRSVVDLRMEPAGLARLRAAGARAESVLERALTRPPASPTPGQPMP